MESTYETSLGFSYKEYFDSEYIGLSNDILNENMCIHRLLWEFQNILLSSAAILFRRFKGQWGAEYIQYYDEGYKNALSGRIITPKQDGLEKIFNECKWSDEFILIENEQKDKRLSRCVFIPVQIQFGSEDEMNNFCLLAFIKPTREIYEDVKHYKGLGYFSEKICKLIERWFALKSYQNQINNRFIQKLYGREFKEYEFDSNLKIIIDRLFWPTPIEDYVYILKIISNKITASDNWQKNWFTGIKDTICLEHDTIARKKCGKYKERCKLAEHNFEELLSLIPYLMINKLYWYPKHCEEGFQIILKQTQRFFDKINFDSMEKRGLLCFFSYNYWQSHINKIDWSKDLLGPKETGRYLLHCINIAFQQLAETSTKENYIDSLIWAISCYGHKVLKIEPRLDISSHLLYLARGESALHSLKSFYRDHFFHSIEVCFLGHLLLESKISENGKCLWQYVAENMNVLSREDVLREWYVAALFHDVGYAMEIFNSVREAMKFFKNSGILSTFSENLAKSLTALSYKAGESYGFEKSDSPEKDHGIIGAEHIKSLIEKIKKSKPEVHDYTYACSAVANHNHRKNTVSFSKNPISFLLVLCDTLQEWNRLTFQYSTAPSTMLEKFCSSQSFSENFSYGPLVKACINLKKENTDSNSFVMMDDTKVLKVALVYSDDINKESGVFNLWLDSICNLQRLDMDALPYKDIEIQFITPIYSKGGKLEHQMHRLREAATETHMNFLHDIFPDVYIEKADTKKAITYYPDAANMPEAGNGKINLLEKEALVLNLRHLTEEKRITGTIGDFRDRLKKWQRYNEDREFKGDYDSEIPE